jgi:ribosome-binding factor A
VGRRQERLGGQILKEISRILQFEVKDSRLGFVTVARVDLSADLSVAKVMVSIMGDDTERKSTLIALDSSKPFIRRQLGSALHIRHVPKVDFKMDLNIDHSLRIQEVLGNLNDPELPPEEEG